VTSIARPNRKGTCGASVLVLEKVAVPNIHRSSFLSLADDLGGGQYLDSELLVGSSRTGIQHVGEEIPLSLGANQREREGPHQTWISCAFR